MTMPTTTKTRVNRDVSKAPTATPRNKGGIDPAIAVVLNAYGKPVRNRLLALRRLILETARATEGVGALEEALKWGQPSYLTTATGSGSTIRIDGVKSSPNQYAVYFHCQTNLVETFRELYPELRYGGNRSILLDAADDPPEAALRHCVALALTYHLNKRRTSKV
jgi:hypothetical protein